LISSETRNPTRSHGSGYEVEIKVVAERVQLAIAEVFCLFHYLPRAVKPNFFQAHKNLGIDDRATDVPIAPDGAHPWNMLQSWGFVRSKLTPALQKKLGVAILIRS